MGIDSGENILHGKKEFFENFAKRYGEDTLRIISYRANRLRIDEFGREGINDTEVSRVQYFKDTQDIILRNIFDRELKEIHTIEDAESYLIRLQGFENTRGREIGKDDKEFREYYNYQLVLIKERLIENGYSEEQILKILQEHQYKKQKFLPLYGTTSERERLITDEKVLRVASAAIAGILKDEQDIQGKLREFAFYRGLKGDYEDEYIEYLLITRNGQPIAMHLLKNFCNIFQQHYKEKNGELVLPSNFSLIEKQNSFSIKDDEDNIIDLQESNLSIDDLKAIKHRPMLTPQNIEWIESLTIIAKNQKLSAINRVALKIKGAFFDRKKAQDYVMEDKQR